MRHSVTAALFGALIAVTAAAEARAQAAAPPAASPAFAKDVLRLMEVTGSLKVGHQMATATMEQVVKSQRVSNPNLPARATEIIRQRIDAEFTKSFAPGGEMASLLTGIYAKHFTQDDIRGLIAFYESPLGKKVVEALPVVAQESITVANQWAASRMPQVMQDIQTQLRAEGLIK